MNEATGASTSVRDVPGVIRDAARVFAAHWPALVSLGLLGAALRSAALWAAVEISDHVPILGQLILVLAPLGYLLPIVAMLFLCRRSLPHLQSLDERVAPMSTTEQRPRRLVDIAVSVLVPFLAVYVSYGLLAEDIARFRNAAFFDEFNRLDINGDLSYDFASRLGIYPVQIALMIVVVAWVVRWSLGRIERRWKFLALAFVGALVEVYYTGQVAGQSLTVKNSGEDWVRSRRLVVWAEDTYHAVIDRLGWFAHPVDNATGWLFSLLGAIDAVVVVPIAWFTVAAVVLGHKLAEPSTQPGVIARRMKKLPAPVASTLTSLFADIASRWSAFWNGLRLIGSAGLIPMLVLSLAFLLAIRIPSLFSMAVRRLVGPMDTSTWHAIAPMEGAIGLALSMAITSAMLAAALNWLVAPSLTVASQAAATSDQISRGSATGRTAGS